MPSHLTRHVIRCILANEPILHSGCLRTRAATTWQHRRAQNASATISFQQRRSIFGLFEPKSSKDDATANAGLDTMADFVRRRRLKARLPEVVELDAAVTAFISSTEKSTSKEIVDTQATLLLQSLRYLFENLDDAEKEEDGKAQVGIRKRLGQRLRRLSLLLIEQTTSLTIAHLDLARFVYEAQQQYDVSSQTLAAAALACVLGRLDQAAEAQDILNKAILLVQQDQQSVSSQEANQAMPTRRVALTTALKSVISAFARQDKEDAMLAALALVKQLNIPQDQSMLGTVIDFYIRRQDDQKLAPFLEAWLEKKDAHENNPNSSAYVDILRNVLTYAATTNQPNLGHGLVSKVMGKSPMKSVWDEVLAFGFALDKSVDDASRMMDVMIESNKDLPRGKEKRLPDISTINRLVEVAIQASDPYLAERLIGMGKARGFEPDARTLVLQMEYRLSVNDVDGALLAYKHLQNKDFSDNADVPIVNRMIVALCNSGRHDFDTISNVAADLSDRRATFTADTVTALAIVHLKRDEVQDVEDLIGTHAAKFSSTDRATVRTAIKDFAIRPDTHLACLWDSYNILRNDFDETPREHRTQIMQACFAKRRPDLAVHIFSHMRMHSRDDTYPDASTYIAAFTGAAQTGSAACLDALHNQMKLDTIIDVTTKMRNALMIAQIAVEQDTAAVATWDDIVASREGPTYNSIVIAFEACQTAVGGGDKADEIWSRLHRNNIELTQRLWMAYIAVVAGRRSISEAVRQLEAAHAKEEVDIDAAILASLTKGVRTSESARSLQEWAKAEHKKAWDELEEILGRQASEELIPALQP